MDSDIGGILRKRGRAEKQTIFLRWLLAVLINGFFYRKYL